MDWKDSVRLAPSNIIKEAIYFCEHTECENCPIAIEGLEHRTRYDKQDEHVPCVDNLIFELANGRTLD